MTPKWIHKNAVITGPHALYPQYFEILPTSGDNYLRALRVQLIAPNILTSTDSITVTVTVALDKTLADSIDHDPVIGISDGENFIGFMMRDKGNYPTLSPCHNLEGKVMPSLLKDVQRGSGPLVSSRTFSSEVKIQIKPNEKWGSCHTEHDGGYVNNQDYHMSLDLTKALYFEFHREQATENHRIKYIVVDVDLE